MNKLSIAEAQIEELKQQLDGSMVAEDMLELTEQILTLNEKTDDMKTIIKDLEALKQLADELEDHVKTKQETQEEIHILLYSEALRECQQIQYDELQTLANHTQAMLKLNRKLQSSSIKGQVKAIDLELRKLESTRAVLPCTIMKPNPLPAYFKADHDSVVFFTRLAAKAELTSSVIKTTNNISKSLTTFVTKIVVIASKVGNNLNDLVILHPWF
ncbi:uncharacterized protein MELLADRAFT_66390 [Melampsora larici-populina 98AG31]|uniref:Dynein associated protein domain-containing protein n=1 Tax=Melampsora larici-populina (strain 98AG31 / pathotype 3-4-7) TaxID=747676 RepID=F4RZ05_MELLP|nr:uncharacterized protein MELLADRAFT_66390 [Melampsora larici-populina 98AG31]EGG02409.1 hypothetical protein MELLADRAFT_66390 [Melampsora larici-populina 98AG31]